MQYQSKQYPTVHGILPALILLLTILVPQTGAARPDCLKLVFNRYCLGGDIDNMAQQMPPAMRQDQGERIALIYHEGLERDYVLAWGGKIYKVVRIYRTASQLRYEELYRLLRNKYGEGADQSSFPSTAHTPGRKQIAIRRGEGYAAHVWPLSQGWHPKLSWTRELGLALSYVADALDQEQAKTSNSGY